MHLIVSAYMKKGLLNLTFSDRCAHRVRGSVVIANVLLASCSDHRVNRDSAAKHLSEFVLCVMPQQLLTDDTLHIKAKQISFSTSETFACMGV